MTKEREELEQKVKTMELEIKNEELEERVQQLQTETEKLRYKLKRRDEPSFGSRALDYISRGVGSVGEGIGYLAKKLALPVLFCGIVGGTGFALYKGCGALIELHEFNVNETKNEAKLKANQAIKAYQQSLQQTLDSIRTAANHGDTSAIKGKISCNDHDYWGNTPSSFLETVINKTLNEDYTLQKLKLVETSHDNYYWDHPVKIEATLIKDGSNPYTIDGVDNVGCGAYCVFRIYREDLDLCPNFTSK